MNLDSKSSDKIESILNKAYASRYLLFIVFILFIYLLLIFKSVTLSHAQPPAITLISQSNIVSGPQIDTTVVSKINQLQNNSVNVSSLFNQARQNPFQE